MQVAEEFFNTMYTMFDEPVINCLEKFQNIVNIYLSQYNDRLTEQLTKLSVSSKNLARACTALIEHPTLFRFSNKTIKDYLDSPKSNYQIISKFVKLRSFINCTWSHQFYRLNHNFLFLLLLKLLYVNKHS